MVEKLLALIGQKYPLAEKDSGPFSVLKAKGMTFHIHAYEAQGLGWVSVMTASGFFGLMKMDTLIINPTAIDMPLLSYDRVHAMGNNTLIYELYDTFIGTASLSATAQAKEEGTCFPDHDLGRHWYDPIKLPESLSKKGKKIHTIPFDILAVSYLQSYLADCSSASSCEATAKWDKAAVYVDGLLCHGGPSTDVFKKALGEEKTATLFRRILFGTVQ